MPPTRSETARRKAMDATKEVIVERGIGGLSIEEIAARSGVAKTTIYRHWPDRSALVLDTIRTEFEHVAAPDTGSLRGDLDAYFARMRELSGAGGDTVSCVIEAATRDPEMALVIDRFAEDRSRALGTILERAATRGELDTDVPIDVLSGVIVGPIAFQKLVRRQKPTPDYVNGCLDVVLAGIAATGRDGDPRA